MFKNQIDTHFLPPSCHQKNLIYYDPTYQIGWARERWTANFWKNTLPMLADNDLLKKGGQLWLPNLGCVQESIETYRDEIMMHYTIKAVEDPLLNPLYAASENVEMELLRCPDALTNETQLRPLLSYSKNPFLVLTRREELYIRVTCVTPSKRDREAHSATHAITPRNLAVSDVELSANESQKSKKSPSRRKDVSSPKIAVRASSPRNRKSSAVITPTRTSVRLETLAQ